MRGQGAVDRIPLARILAELQRLTGAGNRAGRNALGRAIGPAAPNVAGPARDWHIHFPPGPDVLLNGTNPLLLLGELRELGELQVTVDTAAIPPLGEIDPERCYLAWDMVLTTAAAPEAIRDVFIFVEDDCELTIEPRSARRSGADAAADQAGPRSASTGVRERSRNVESSGLDRKTGSAGQPGGRTGHRAGAAERGRRPGATIPTFWRSPKRSTG